MSRAGGLSKAGNSKASGHGWTLLEAVPVVVISLVLVLLMLRLALFTHLFGQENTVISNTHEISLAVERYLIDYPVEPADFQQIVSSGVYGNPPEYPVNPYTAKPSRPVNKGKADSIGNFSYFYFIGEVTHGGTESDHILVGYSECPEGTEPELIWIGGECGNNLVYLARGLSPQEVLTRLRSILQSQWGLEDLVIEFGY